MAAPQHSMNKFSSAFGLHINSDLRDLLIVNIKDMMEAAEVEDFLHIFIHIADDDFSSLLFAAFLKLHEETQARRTDILQFLAVDDKFLIGKIGYAVQGSPDIRFRCKVKQKYPKHIIEILFLIIVIPRMIYLPERPI